MSVTARPESVADPCDADVPTEPIYRLSVDQYHAMATAGILDEDTPVELLEGWLIQKMTKHPPHRMSTRLARQALERVATGHCVYVDTQEPITTLESEPEPDVVVVRGHTRDYPDRHPGPGDVLMILEVADTSLRRDRGTKKRIYARAAISVYWILNLIDRQLEVYTEPSGPRKRPDYRRRHEYGEADEVPVVLDGVEVGRVLVREMLP